MVKIIKYILLIMLGCGILQTTAFCSSIYDLVSVKHGKLTQDETWSGKILIIGDVLIPKGIKLTIAPNTWLIFNDTDIDNLGQIINTPEMIVKGILATPSTNKNSIQILTINDKKIKQLFKQKKSLNLYPKDLDLTPLQDEWRSYFRDQYAPGWAIIYVILTVLY